MKRITSLLLAFSLSVFVAGCGSEAVDSGSTAPASDGPALSSESSDAAAADAGSDTAEKEEAAPAE